ncbi:hypothetical protein PR003_g29498 [Phytophthora rubi]|uniref:Uncharacterized protein n=1 Tax=Phytophthora rubi TaxID=129364 RepID=A0A6A3HAA8_9STRA|nr:hypothetical protein PR002_g28363 [Phytophthora rubi]KAE8969819.1 hypothetical protein PR001_g27386 [Phytophthora rubi]KAE9274832.1 hypothetical protein PR003_g29498 [Phytophthora rubi]
MRAAGSDGQQDRGGQTGREDELAEGGQTWQTLGSDEVRPRCGPRDSVACGHGRLPNDEWLNERSVLAAGVRAPHALSCKFAKRAKSGLRLQEEAAIEKKTAKDSAKRVPDVVTDKQTSGEGDYVLQAAHDAQQGCD